MTIFFQSDFKLGWGIQQPITKVNNGLYLENVAQSVFIDNIIIQKAIIAALKDNCPKYDTALLSIFRQQLVQ